MSLRSGTLIAACTALMSGCDSGPDAPTTGQAGAPTAKLVDVEAIGATHRGAQASALGRPIVVHPSFSAGLRYEVNGDQVVHTFLERPPTNPDQPEWVEYAYSTSFAVTATAVRQSNVVYVAGVASSGDCVVERWTMGEPKGSHYYHVNAVAAPFGTPMSPMPMFEFGIVGGTYIPVDQRSSKVRQQRQELFRGSLNERIVRLVSDPEGRYLLMLGQQPRAVYQMQQDPPASPIGIVDSSVVPILANTIYGTYSGQHASLGRLVVIEVAMPADQSTGRVVLRDANNDAVFDSFMMFDEAEWNAAGFKGAVWVKSSFVDHSGL